MRWLDYVSMDLRNGCKRMERQSKEPRSVEAYCRGGQGPPRAVAPFGGIRSVGSASRQHTNRFINRMFGVYRPNLAQPTNLSYSKS
jgi:hypothetical protein